MVGLETPSIAQVASHDHFREPVAEHVARGEQFFNGGNLPAALGEFDQANSLSPANPRLLFARGTLLGQLGDDVGALRDFERMVQLSEGEPQLLKFGLWSQGVALFWLERPSEALESLTKALDLDDGDPELWAAKGVVLDCLGDRREALRAFDRSLSLRDEPKVREARRLILDAELRQLTKRGVISWRSGKPKGPRTRIELTPGPSMSEWIIENRR